MWFFVTLHLLLTIFHFLTGLPRGITLRRHHHHRRVSLPLTPLPRLPPLKRIPQIPPILIHLNRKIIAQSLRHLLKLTHRLTNLILLLRKYPPLQFQHRPNRPPQHPPHPTTLLILTDPPAPLLIPLTENRTAFTRVFRMVF